jgi:putative sigma-54 modulation protein
MSVRIDISVHNLDLSDRLRDYVTKKATRLDRFLDTLEEAKVDLRYAQSARSADDRQVAQLTVRGKGVLLRAEERSNDIFTSFDTVMEKIERQIERYKGRHWRGRGDGRSVAELTTEAVEAEAPTVEETIARRKTFRLNAMNEREAIEQMGLLGHEVFFVFLNADTHQVSVLYRRRDGTLGLIDTAAA